MLHAVAALLAGNPRPSCSRHGLCSCRTVFATGLRRRAAPALPVPCADSAPLAGGVQAPAFGNRFVSSLSELLDSLSPSSALRGLRVYALDISVHGGVRVVLCRFTQKCAECFLAEVRAVYGEAFLLCPEIVISVLPGGRAGTDGICLCPTSKLCFESVWVPVGAIFCYSKQNV